MDNKPGPHRLLLGARREGGSLVLIKLWLVALGWLICASSAAYGKIERFTDSQGTLHITNQQPDKAPEEKKPVEDKRARFPSAPSRKPIATPPAPEPVEPRPPPEPPPEALTPEGAGTPEGSARSMDSEGARPPGDGN
jgi:hypothetical protein